MIKQRTLSRSIKANGIGLHSGKKVYMTLKPAPENMGIVFRRVDLAPIVDIPAFALNVVSTQLSTNLAEGSASVSTVEHLMSALAGLGIDNAIIEVDAEEIPIMDGSAAPFVFLIQSAGIQEQSAAKEFVRILKPIGIEVGEKTASFRPFNGFKLGFKIEFDHPAFTEKHLESSLEFSSHNFVKEVSRARTFGFMRDIEFLRSNNLALGGNFDNAIVVDDQKVLNQDGLRYENEFVKHKILDAVGDLYLLGRSIIGEYYGFKSGHHLNNLLLRELLNHPDAFERVTFENGQTPVPIDYQPSTSL